MGDVDLIGGTVVSAGGSFRADVAIRGGRIAGVGEALPSGGERVDVSGRLVMPGFIDAHTHIDVPFGAPMADDWDTGSAAALAGGTTTIVDFAEQRPGQSLEHTLDTWHGQAKGRTRVDYGLHVIVTDLTEAVRGEIPTLPTHGICSVKVFMAYKGTSLFMRDEELFGVMQLAADADLLVMVHAENGDVVAELQQQALERGDVEPVWHARTRPHEAEAEATARAIRLAEIAGAPLAVVHVTCASALEEIRRAHARGQEVHGETCPQYLVLDETLLEEEDFAGAKYVCSPPLREQSSQGPLWQALRDGGLVLVGSDHCSFNFAGHKERGRDDFTKIPNGLPGVEERSSVLWTHGVREGRLSPERFVACLSTNQAQVHGMYPQKGAVVPGADADVVVWDPELTIAVTCRNRHGNVDYTPYEGMKLVGGPERVYVRGSLAYRGGAVVAPAGSGRFVQRALA